MAVLKRRNKKSGEIVMRCVPDGELTDSELLALWATLNGDYTTVAQALRIIEAEAS